MRGCFDPEIPVNIVDLGLIYDLQISEPTCRGQAHGQYQDDEQRKAVVWPCYRR